MEASPLLVNQRDDQIHAFSFTHENSYYYFGWNPDGESWEQIVHIDIGGPGSEWNIEAIEVLDDETGEIILHPNFSSDTVVEDVHDFIWEYIEHVYDDVDHFWYIPDSVESSNL